MNKTWAICACLQDIDGGLLDRSKPFKTYYVEASTAGDAVKSFKQSLPGINVVMAGNPRICTKE